MNICKDLYLFTCFFIMRVRDILIQQKDALHLTIIMTETHFYYEYIHTTTKKLSIHKYTTLSPLSLSLSQYIYICIYIYIFL